MQSDLLAGAVVDLDGRLHEIKTGARARTHEVKEGCGGMCCVICPMTHKHAACHTLTLTVSPSLRSP